MTFKVFARFIVNIPENEYEIITQARKTLLFNKEEPWVKKSGDEEFDVPMGCFDGAEICDLIGIYILNSLKTVIPTENIRLYRDDGLCIIRASSGPEVESKRKQIVKLFKDCRLKNELKVSRFSRCPFQFHK